MRSFYILSFLICLLFWTSCKNDNKAQQESGDSAPPSYVGDSINPPKMETSSQNPASQTQSASSKSGENATSEVNTGSGHDYTFLTFKLFKINGSFIPGKDPKEQPYKDHYLDLLPDGTFKWYKGKELSYSGHWGYNHDKGILLLNPSDKNQKPTEWNVIFNDDMVVFTGTNTFENNGYQLQLIRKDQID